MKRFCVIFRKLVDLNNKVFFLVKFNMKTSVIKIEYLFPNLRKTHTRLQSTLFDLQKKVPFVSKLIQKKLYLQLGERLLKIYHS